MTILRVIPTAVALVLGWAVPVCLQAETPHPAPDFKEVYDLIREHLAQVEPAELNATAVNALISALSPKVSLVGQTNTTDGDDAVMVRKTSLFDGPIAYIRIGRVEAGLDKAVREAWQQLATTNKPAGMVLDLRFAGGTDYAAAAATADLFVKKEQPLLDWGRGMAHTTDQGEKISVPLTVLVNGKTAAAAEALAAVLRQGGAGLILGGRTAGQAMIAQDYPLANGERLRIASTPIQLGDGSSLSAQGVQPDISVTVSLTDDRSYYADPFQELSRSGPASGPTNGLAGSSRARRPRFNEAELVRERRNGAVPDSELAGTGEGDSPKPTVRDPVLGRALDFLKGLSLVRSTRS
jgi:hypothetical protein